MQKWEYLTLTLDRDPEANKSFWSDNRDDERGVKARLNELGQEGWELVALSENIASGIVYSSKFVFKRPIE